MTSKSWRKLSSASVAVLLALFVVLPPLAAEAQEVEAHILAWGDSLTSGGDWMSHLDDLGYPNWTWIDKGLSGEDSWNAADSVYTSSTRRFRNWWESEYTQAPGDIFVFMWGTNDVRKPGWPDGTPPNASVTQASLEQIVDDVLALGVPVVLVVPPLFVAGGSHRQEQVDVFNANIARLRQIVEEIVATRAGEPIIVADVATPWVLLEGFPDLDYYRKANGDADGVHPGTQVGPSGYSGRYHVAEAIAPAIVAIQRVPEPENAGFVAIGVVALIAAKRRKACWASQDWRQ